MRRHGTAAVSLAGFFVPGGPGLFFPFYSPCPLENLALSRTRLAVLLARPKRLPEAGAEA